MKGYAEREGIMSQHRKMLTSSLASKNVTLVTPLPLFYRHLVLFITTLHRFVEYIERKCFISFLQSAVDSRRKRDENPNSSIVAEAMNLLANSNCDYQIKDPRRHIVTKYLSDEKTYATINIKVFNNLEHVNKSLYEVELIRAQIEQWANQCQVFHSAVHKTADVGALVQIFHQSVWRKQVLKVWNGLRFAVSCSCRKRTRTLYPNWKENRVGAIAVKKLHAIVSLLMLPENSSPECPVTSTKNMTRRSLDSSMWCPDVQTCYASAARRTAAMMLPRTCLNSIAKASTNVC